VAKEFKPTDRDQSFLLPPDVRDWLAADHLVWFVIDVIDQLDTARFEALAKLGGPGRQAYEPRMLLGVLLYGYACGQRSSRQLERLCEVDVAFRVLTGNQVPDHTTLARFRARHDEAMAELFTQVLVLCARAGLGRLGVVAIDGTKIAANASLGANAEEDKLRALAEQILGEAADTDAAEDALFGDQRGDELPPDWRDRSGRRNRIKKALDDLSAEREQRQTAQQTERVAKAERRVAALKATLANQRSQVAAANQARAERAAAGSPVGGPRPVPVEDHIKVRRVQARLDRAQAKLDAERATPRPLPPREQRQSRMTTRNTTDPDSRVMPTRNGWLQGFNAQLAVTDDQIILATALTTTTGDDHQLVPMMTAAVHAAATLAAARPEPDPAETIATVLADAGYHSEANLAAPGPDRLIAPGTSRDQHTQAAENPATGPPPPDATPVEANAHRLRTPDGHATYKRRGVTVEPVNGHLKDRIGLRRFSRRGLQAAQAELDLAATAANLLKIYRTTPA
jgi:transposase